MTRAILADRRAGVLLHPTSLPGETCGDLGPEAQRLVDFLADAGLTVWQTLPLGPTHDDLSPYHCLSVHAGNPVMISIAQLKEAGWLAPEADGRDRAASLAQARHGFAERASADDRAQFEEFKRGEAYWLDDYALYQALRQDNAQAGWWQWPAPVRDRDEQALRDARVRLRDTIEQVCFEQFAFFWQWHLLREYANAKGVWLFGDMPIFVALDSAEVWAHREYFTLDERGQPEVVAGVPPDYYSKHGQRWGNPLYRWERMQADGFKWWLARMHTQLELFDLVRIDHFRGFEAYWEIPASEDTAVKGHWVKAPGEALFDALHAQFDPLPIVAEDLGHITPEVHRLREKYGIPGMAVLQFAFDGGAGNPYLPHRLTPDTVVYTGTHDNDTTLAWYNALPWKTQDYVREYLGFPEESMPWPLIRAALASTARLAIVPLQDILGLGEGERMNTPGTTSGNWQWRFSWGQLERQAAERVRRLVELYGRAPAGIAEKS